MTWQIAALICGGLGVAAMAIMAWRFWSVPEKAMAQAHHTIDQLPVVMSGRYFGLAILFAAAVVYGDLFVLSFVFALGAFLGFFDAWIYLRVKQPAWTHLGAGSAALVGLVVSAIAANAGSAIA